MRGLFTAGVLDVFMEHQIEFDGAIGVSAGAVFGCNYKSNQPGRTLRYNCKYCQDPRYVSIRSLIKTGDIYGVEFCYHEIPEKLDPFDAHAFQSSPMEFYVVCTDLETGKPVYHKCEEGGAEDLKWMQASASMPLVSRIVNIGGQKLLDGGISDSVPLRYFQSIGYRRNVVILTQPKTYRKEKNRLLPVIRPMYRKYPEFVKAAADRHMVYNETIDFIQKEGRLGTTFIIQPEEPLNIGRIERDPERLKRVYQLGKEAGERSLSDVKNFLRAGK